MEGLALIATSKGTHGKIKLFEHAELGRVFVINDEIQHVEAWSPVYHEPLVHLAASFVKTVENVLILGGGTLYAATEVLKYDSVKRVILIDRDPKVVEMAIKHYRHAQKCVADPRFEYVHDDAYKTLSRMQRGFDLVVNDGADLWNVRLNSRHQRDPLDIFSLMTSVLKKDGVCADVVYRHVFEQKKVQLTLKRLTREWRLALSLVFLPEYHGILHTLSIWGGQQSTVDQSAVSVTNLKQRTWQQNPHKNPCTYYDPRFLRYYLHVPPYIREVFKKTVS